MKEQARQQQQDALKRDSLLRPKCLDDYVGQQDVRKQLQLFIAAARKRGEALDHTLLFGPPGLGKTTLSMIIANEMQANIHITTGPALERAGDIAALMTSLAENDVLFIDEIHRLHPAIEETMYSALEDFRLDIILGDGGGARAVHLNLPRFTLVGATTRVGQLTSPLRDRFGIVCNLSYYQVEEIQAIIQRSAQLLDIKIEDAGALEIANRSRRTPRIANRLLKRTRDYAEIEGDGVITHAIARAALQLLGVDGKGLDAADKHYLTTLIEKFKGGPVGLETLAVALGESPDTVEIFIEPYLLKEGFITRQPRGRVASDRAYTHFKNEGVSLATPPPQWQNPLWNTTADS